ncbi:U-box domain-containing protein 39 [Panicum miliaceum]|uniref:U-box domain-containing protein 39 n=1 Tax=Panicum miliaceum TaxID=4540 RepID=A0A3L6S080_PANMI|nr:U-box domain-containing protein 39 [Panicum miliaceum]
MEKYWKKRIQHPLLLPLFSICPVIPSPGIFVVPLPLAISLRGEAPLCSIPTLPPCPRGSSPLLPPPPVNYTINCKITQQRQVREALPTTSPEPMATGTGQPWWAPPPPTVTEAPSAPPFPSPPLLFTADPPDEFLCPISGSLMADPIFVPPSQTFERACIQACAALAFSPPAISFSTPLMLIPNVVLHTAILNWCNRLGLP